MNNEPWHADIQISEELVKRCVQQQFPSLAPLTAIKCLGEGWDNKVFLVNEKIIFRFPRRKIAIELIARENRVLKNLHSLLDIDIPKPEYVGQPTPRYPYRFQGYEILPGTSGCHAQLSVQERTASITTLANFLKQLHRIDAIRALELGAKPQVFDRTDIRKTMAAFHYRIEKISALELCNINRESLQAETIAAQQIELPRDNKCLIHGDLYCRHLLFNKGHLTGIIDWGDLGINNRSVDLAVVWSFYPASCHQRFFEIYGTVDQATWQYARFLGLYSAFTLMLYGHDTGDALLVTEAINAVKRINVTIIYPSFE